MALSGSSLPAAWNYGAVERAFRNYSNREGVSIFEPGVGKKFESISEAFEFYNLYSWEVGFGVRLGRCRENKSGKRTMQDIVCACEGRNATEGVRSVRCCCPAMIRLLLQEDDSWAVSRFNPLHSHPLSRTIGERRQWKSHNRIDQMSRDLIMHLRNNNVQISRVCSIVGSLHGHGGYVPFSRRSVRSLCGRLAQESIEGDMEKTIAAFEEIRTVDPQLVVKVDSDDHGRVRSLFWAHGTSCRSYKHFGDVVTFDTTYRTNLYNLPFGLFVGVNHHFQSVVFAAVLLTEETTESFRWAFRTFVDCMGRHPQTILTDQCQAMRNALEAEMPSTRHRWCKWHVLKKAKESLGSVYTKSCSFKNKLHALLDEVVVEEEFESRWQSLVSEYKLTENQFMTRAYENRKMWAKPYFRDTFCAGMTSTQRSESANHMLKTYIARAAPMHLFVKQYSRLVTDREEEEGREEHATTQITPSLRFGVPLEAHAAGIYTRNLFEKFSKEMFMAGSFNCSAKQEDGSFSVNASRVPASSSVRTEFRVSPSSDGELYLCDCKLFEHMGLPCRHIIKVLMHVGVEVMPAKLVLTRWTIHARADGGADSVPDVASLSDPDSGALHAVLYTACMELLAMGRTSRQAFEVALGHVSRAKAAITSMVVIPPSTGASPCADAGGNDVVGSNDLNTDLGDAKAPPRVRSRGRPRQSRFKSPVESPGASKTRNRAYGASGDATDAPAGGNKRALSEEIADEQPPRRKCKLCGEFGHYRSTCGRKSTYKA